MELHIMERNIHQMGRQYSRENGRSMDGAIPDWIIDEIPDDMNKAWRFREIIRKQREEYMKRKQEV